MKDALVCVAEMAVMNALILAYTVNSTESFPFGKRFYLVRAKTGFEDEYTPYLKSILLHTGIFPTSSNTDWLYLTRILAFDHCTMDTWSRSSHN